MNTITSCKLNPTWEGIEKQTLESFDLDNVGINYAIDAWRKATGKIRDAADEGRDLIVRVCNDVGFAKKLQQNEELPKPVRFLAQIVVEANTYNHLSKKERAIGFECFNH